jgi:hypothetical protein
MTDPDISFSPPVRVKTSQVGQMREVRTVRAALEQLNEMTKRGRKWHDATEICAAAMAGGFTPAEARTAFEAAAKQAGMLIEQ